MVRVIKSSSSLELRTNDLKEEKIGPQCVRVAAAFLFHWYVNTVLSSMYSYFTAGCRKANALISLGILGAYAWVLIERQLFLD